MEHKEEFICRDGTCCPQTFNEALMELVSEIGQLIIKKQEDYGKDNILKFGELGIIIRSSDKLERLSTLVKSGMEPNNESAEDTWRDLVGYALLALMLRKGWFELPLLKCTLDLNEGKTKGTGPKD